MALTEAEIQTIIQAMQAGQAENTSYLGGFTSPTIPLYENRSLNSYDASTPGYAPDSTRVQYGAFGYADGDEWEPGSRAEEETAALQEQMIAAGWYDGEYIRGVWDPSWANAMAKLMASANAAGITWEDMLARSTGAGGLTGGHGGGGAAAPKLPNPEDVKALLNDSAYNLIGRHLDTAALDAGVQAFYNTYKSPPAGYSAADPSTISDQYLTSSAPAEVQAHSAVSAYGVLADMLGGVGG